MGRLVRDDREATVTQITTRYNQGMQNTISEQHTTRRTLKLMGFSSRRPHRGLMSLDICCNIQMVGSEYGVKNMKAWLHPAWSQRFRLVVV